MATTTATLKPDRITRAVAIIRSGKIVNYQNGNYAVQSERGKSIYTVSPDGSCTCADFKKNHLPCKHVWATVGRAAALAISYFRDAYSLVELRAFGEAFAEYAPATPAGLLAFARAQFKRERERIISRITFAPVEASSLGMAA